ncbi:MAG: DUF4476 domain-containing protein [Planctomycetia bacterium]|nr:DUF4476 domain-containing protein [Planctomycetia bacterium]
MYRIVVLIALYCVPSLQAQFATERNNREDANSPVAGMLKDLAEARELLKRTPGSANRDKVDLLLTRIELQLKQLMQAQGNFNNRPTAMSNESFNRFLTNFRSKAFDKDKIGFLEDHLLSAYVTSDQAIVLLKQFSFDNDRIRAAVLLYDHLIDKENLHRVLETFAFDSSRKSVMDRLKARK